MIIASKDLQFRNHLVPKGTPLYHAVQKNTDFIGSDMKWFTLPDGKIVCLHSSEVEEMPDENNQL